MKDIWNNRQHAQVYLQARADYKMLKVSSKPLKQALAAAEVKVHASTIRKRRRMFKFLADVYEEETFGLSAGIMYFG